MKTVKTKANERTTYTYNFNGGNVILRPGENGVTEEDIKRLHALDDSEVYFNNKSMHPDKTDDEKEMIKAWRKDYIQRFKNEHGYKPNSLDVDSLEKEMFPKNWNLSLNWLVNDDANPAKTKLDKLICFNEEPANIEVEHLYEVIAGLTERQCTIVKMVGIENFTIRETAFILGIGKSTVQEHYKRAIELIKKKY